jgi:hypothetical protein
MKTNYKGYKITAERDQAMGGWTNIYFSVYREKDGLLIEDSFTSGDEKIRDMIKYMKHRVDQFIETKGKSECLENQY